MYRVAGRPPDPLVEHQKISSSRSASWTISLECQPFPTSPSLSGAGKLTGKNGTAGGTSLVVQGLRLLLPVQRVWVQPLVGELRSHMPESQKVKTQN